jgi:hypothetical protein
MHGQATVISMIETDHMQIINHLLKKIVAYIHKREPEIKIKLPSIPKSELPISPNLKLIQSLQF